MTLIARLAVVSAVLLLLGACGGEDTQRAGGPPTAKPAVLTLANGNAQTDELQHFIDKVDELSDGRLRVRPVNDWRAGDKQYEKSLIEDVAAGKADLGWVGSRALTGVGVKSFEPLNAPFLLDSYEAQDEVLRGDVAKRMLGDLERVGVTGLAALPGPLRFLQLDREIDGTGLAGLRVGGIDSAIQQTALKAMGAEPIVIAAGDRIDDLNGVESYPVAIHGNHYVDSAKYTIADMPLWPRPFVIFADTDAWNELTDADRKLLLQAAEDARPEVLAATLEREQAAFEGMCKAGNRTVDLGADGRERMQQAVEGVLAGLRDDPETRDAMAEIESVSARRSPHSIACAGGSGDRPATLEGTFEATLRKSEPGSDSIADTWTECGTDSIKVTFELSDGRAVHTLDCASGPVTGFDEPYSVFRDVIKFGGTGGTPFTARWKLEGRRLRFSDPAPKPVPPDGKYVWERTWVKTD